MELGQRSQEISLVPAIQADRQTDTKREYVTRTETCKGQLLLCGRGPRGKGTEKKGLLSWVSLPPGEMAAAAGLGGLGGCAWDPGRKLSLAAGGAGTNFIC